MPDLNNPSTIPLLASVVLLTYGVLLVVYLLHKLPKKDSNDND